MSMSIGERGISFGTNLFAIYCRSDKTTFSARRLWVAGKAIEHKENFMNNKIPKHRFTNEQYLKIRDFFPTTPDCDRDESTKGFIEGRLFCENRGGMNPGHIDFEDPAHIEEMIIRACCGDEETLMGVKMVKGIEVLVQRFPDYQLSPVGKSILRWKNNFRDWMKLSEVSPYDFNEKLEDFLYSIPLEGKRHDRPHF